MRTLFLLCLVSLTAFAQDSNWKVRATKGLGEPPAPKEITPGRFIIVNPNGTQVVRTTFLIDTATGRTWRLVEDATKVPSWEEMEIR